MSSQPPPFFKRGPAPLARFVFFASLSVALLVLDVHFRYLESLRLAAATAIYPLQRAARMPGEAISGGADYFTSVSQLQAENALLQKTMAQNAGAMLRLQHLEAENLRLRRLVEISEQKNSGGQIAEILYSARDPFARRVIIDKGMQQNIQAGRVVIDEAGVVGQVTRVFPLMSEVTLITDKNHTVPVQVVRNGLRSVLAGAGGGRLELRFMAANADVQNGDILVTSGIDGVYQAGLPVARITHIERDAAYSFARIACEPTAGVDRYAHVLVMAPRGALPQRPAELDVAADDDKPAKGGKLRRKARDRQ